MNRLISQTLILTLAIFFFGCAATYKPINPKSLHYTAQDSEDGIKLSYKYGVLRETGNKKYAKKEDKKGIRLVAVKVTNNTDKTLVIGDNAEFYSGQNQVFLMTPMAVKNSIRQIVPGYLPYLLLTFLTLNVSSGTTVETHHIGYPIGPGVTFINMAIAGGANANMLEELNANNLLNKEIKSGETVFGIIAVRDMGYNPISLKMTEN